MADKKNLCAQIDTALHARVRQEQEASGKTLSEYVEQLIQNYYNMKENTKMTGDMRTMAIQLPDFPSTPHRCGLQSLLAGKILPVLFSCLKLLFSLFYKQKRPEQLD